MAKAIKFAIESSGFVYNTIPGSTGDLNRERTQLDDTIFGRDFGSSEAGLINWNGSANGFYKGFAGYVADLIQGGASTPFTDENASQIGENVFEIDEVEKNMWDRTVTLVVNDGGSPISESGIVWIDFLFGRVKLTATPAGAITFDGSYFVQASVGKANTFSLTQTADTLDTTDFETAQGNNAFSTFIPTLLSVSLELGGFYDLTNGFFDALKAGTELIVELNPDGNLKSRARGFFKMITDNQTGDVGGDEIETVTFALSVPEDLTQPPFSWVHESDTTLSQSIQDILTAWAGKSATSSLQYLPDGVTGLQGDVVITEASLAGGVDVMNEFAFNFQGTGELIAI